jgi:predicted heme/steroid binding protein
MQSGGPLVFRGRFYIILLGVFMSTNQKFTLEELAKFDGKEGRSAYVAYNGKVYDVTGANLWFEGNHLGEHEAGRDLTEALDTSSHGNRVIESMKLIGELTT